MIGIAGEPQYFAVLPGLDVTVPVGIGMGITGNSSITPSQNAGAGDVEIGLRTTYRAVWEVGLQFTHFIGATKRQPFADRDFVSFSIKRTF